MSSVIRELVSKKREAMGGEALPPFEEGFIGKMVSRADNLPDRERINTDYIHVSAMVGWCPRKYVLQARSDIHSYTNRIATGAHRVMWELGKAAERHVRNSFIKEVNYRGVFGSWICRCYDERYNRGMIHHGFYDESKTCGICRGKLNNYKEFTLFDDENHVSGNPDLLMVRRKKIFPVEIKSLTNSTSANASKRGFDTIVQPFGDHMFQVDSYHYMLERCFDEDFGLLAGDRVVVFYVNKEFKYGSPYKEYWRKAVEPQRKALVRREFSTAKKVWNAIHDKGPVPERKLCPNCHCDRAKQCPVVQECFAKK